MCIAIVKLLHSIDPPYYGMAAILAVASFLVTRKWAPSLLTGYLLLVLAVTVLDRRTGTNARFQLHLFRSYNAWKAQKAQVLRNILLFIPVGILAGKWVGKRGIWFGIGLSSAIEIVQLISHRGLFELDDIIHNTLGTILGYLILLVLHRLTEQFKYKE